MASANGQMEDVLVGDKSSVKIITLNRPKQLNVLLAAMVSRLLELFLACAENSLVKLIILKGNGRAFCAGADVVEIICYINEGEVSGRLWLVPQKLVPPLRKIFSR